MRVFGVSAARSYIAAQDGDRPRLYEDSHSYTGHQFAEGSYIDVHWVCVMH